MTASPLSGKQCSFCSGRRPSQVALSAASGPRKVYAWGSNATGQLGVADGVGCGFAEKLIPSNQLGGLTARDAGGCEIDGEPVVRLRESNGTERSAATMTLAQLQQAAQGPQAAALIVQVPDREVPKAEKKKLLHPHEVFLSATNAPVDGVFASAECTFVTVQSGDVLGCGLNGDGQLGVGFASMAVPTLRAVRRLRQATWLGGGLHSTAALADGRVFTWGKAEECGLGLGEKDSGWVERVVGTI